MSQANLRQAVATCLNRGYIPVNARRILRVCPTDYSMLCMGWPLLRLEEAEDVERACRLANARAYVRQTGGVK